MGMKMEAAVLNVSETAVWLARYRLVLAGAAAVAAWCAIGFADG